MDQKRVTLIVSDLHMGDGTAGDDFVDDAHQFSTFVKSQAAKAEGRDGQIELIINGDFLELVQVFPKPIKRVRPCIGVRKASRYRSLIAFCPATLPYSTR